MEEVQSGGFHTYKLLKNGMFLVELFFTCLIVPVTPLFVELLKYFIYDNSIKFNLFFTPRWTFSHILPYFWEIFPFKTITLDKAISRTQIT